MTGRTLCGVYFGANIKGTGEFDGNNNLNTNNIVTIPKDSATNAATFNMPYASRGASYIIDLVATGGISGPSCILSLFVTNSARTAFEAAAADKNYETFVILRFDIY